MNRDSILTMTFKEKKQTLDVIFKEYQIARFNLDHDSLYYPPQPMMVKEKNATPLLSYDQKLLNHMAKQNHYREYCDFIEKAMLQLTRAQAQIIERDFIKEAKPDWWMDYYSKSTYYRYKHEAVDRILWLLYS